MDEVRWWKALTRTFTKASSGHVKWTNESRDRECGERGIERKKGAWDPSQRI